MATKKKTTTTKAKETSATRTTSLETLSLLLTAITETWPNDPSQPGVVLARLKTGKVYGSICRYERSMGDGRRVVCSYQGDTPGETLRGLAYQLLEKRDAIDNLRRSL